MERPVEKKKSIVNRLEELRCNKALEQPRIARILFIMNNSVYVECPYCYHQHRHGYTGDTVQFRTAHCFKGEGKSYSYDPSIFKAMRG